MIWIVLTSLFVVFLSLIILVRMVKLKRVVVLQYQLGLLFERGMVKRKLSPGVYWGHVFNTIVVVDGRMQVLNVPGQEILSADGITLKISLAGVYEVVDAKAYVLASTSAATNLYLYVQQALRSATAEMSFETILASRSNVNSRMIELVAERVRELGLKLQSLEIRDLMLSGEIKRAYSDAVTAQKQGLAALERARGETASLRSLANAARIMQDHPALLQLRAIQAAEAGKGSTIVLGVSAASAAVPGASVQG